MSPIARDERRGSAQRQLGLLWGFVALILVVLSPLAPPIASALPSCPLKVLLGIPCPSCGAARSAVALAALDLPLAVATNPLITIGWLLLVLGGVWAGVRAIFGSGVREPRWCLGIGWRVAAVGVVALNWAYVIWVGV